MMLLQLNPTIPVLAKKHGYGDAFIVADYGPDVNSVYYVRFSGGVIKHFYSDDILLVGNPMNGKGWDLEWPVREGSPEEFPKGTQDPKGLQEAYEKARKDDTSVAKDDTSPRKVDTYNPERLPEDGGRNRKKWMVVYDLWKRYADICLFHEFLDEQVRPPKCYHFDTWTKVYNWYVSLSQYKANSFLDFLIEFYPAPDINV